MTENIGPGVLKSVPGVQLREALEISLRREKFKAWRKLEGKVVKEFEVEKYS
jgi:hypothetical protein